MRKEERQRAYRINCRPAYSAGWQGINFELKCNVMGRVGSGRSRVRVRGNQEAVRGRNGTQGCAFPSMTQNRVMCAQGGGRGVEPLCQGDSDYTRISHPPAFMAHCQRHQTTLLCQLRKQSHLLRLAYVSLLSPTVVLSC